MGEGRLAFDKRNALLAEMTDDVAEIVLEDNRLQTLALSIAEAGGAQALPGHVRAIEMLEASAGSTARSRAWNSCMRLINMPEWSRASRSSQPEPQSTLITFHPGRGRRLPVH